MPRESGRLMVFDLDSLHQVDQLVGSGEMVDGITLAAVLLWRRAT